MSVVIPFFIPITTGNRSANAETCFNITFIALIRPLSDFLLML